LEENFTFIKILYTKLFSPIPTPIHYCTLNASYGTNKRKEEPKVLTVTLRAFFLVLLLARWCCPNTNFWFLIFQVLGV
jgi:hypothetical protein